MRLGAIPPYVYSKSVPDDFFAVLIPAHCRVIVMGARIEHGVRGTIGREMKIVVVRAKGELQHPCTEQSGLSAQLVHRLVDVAQILRFARRCVQTLRGLEACAKLQTVLCRMWSAPCRELQRALQGDANECHYPMHKQDKMLGAPLWSPNPQQPGGKGPRCGAF